MFEHLALQLYNLVQLLNLSEIQSACLHFSLVCYGHEVDNICKDSGAVSDFYMTRNKWELRRRGPK